MNCGTVDELAAAYALGAVDPAEEREVSDHLASCAEPHTEARDLVGAAALVTASAVPVTPSSALRSRLMATVAATPQEHRVAVRQPTQDRAPTAPWWRPAWAPTALAAVALAAAIGLGAWNVSLGQQVADRDAVMRAIASADAIHRVSGSAGDGLLIESGGDAMFMAEGLADLPEGHLYELWLIGEDGAPVAVGTLDDVQALALVTLDRGVGQATTFAVTVETARVDAPTTEPVLVATLEG